MANYNNKDIITYIVPQVPLNSGAISANIARRKKILISLGYSVYLVEYSNLAFFRTCLSIWKLRKKINLIIIRIDGSCVLDKFTLLKLFIPTVPLIWEIHGFPEEHLDFADNLSGRWFVMKNNIKRKIFSHFVCSYIFISHELQNYALKKIQHQRTIVIPNFVLSNKVDSHYALSSVVSKSDYTFILWGGSCNQKWQATNIIQNVAENIYKRNKQIIFILVGSNYWHSIKKLNNIIFLDPIPHDQFIDLISHVDICLALYNKPRYFPFYFHPMKILDYMFAGKPIIATNIGSISRHIQNGENGYLTNNSVDDISSKILHIHKSNSLAKKFSVNTKKTLMSYYSEKMTLNLYKNLLQSTTHTRQ